MVKNEKLERLLNFIEEKIDIKHVKESEKLTLDALEYKKIPRIPLSVSYLIEDKYEPYLYAEAYYDPEKMLYNELLYGMGSAYRAVCIKDDCPMQIRSNHGIGIIPSLFGAESKIVGDNMPWVNHLDNMQQLKDIIMSGVPGFDSDLACRVIETLRYFRDKLSEYPKCYRTIRITQPDMQGPFDIAHLLIGAGIFYQVYDDPEFLKELLELITKTYIGFRKHIDSILTDKTDSEAVYVHGSIYGGEVLLKDDTAAMNLSNDMYKEFSGQYNEKILNAFKSGGSIHSCGDLGERHFALMYSKNLKGINYGNPEMQKSRNLFGFWEEIKVPVIWWGYNQKYEFLKNLHEAGICTGVVAACTAKSFEQAIDIVKEHNERQIKLNRNGDSSG